MLQEAPLAVVCESLIPVITKVWQQDIHLALEQHGGLHLSIGSTEAIYRAATAQRIHIA